MQEVYPKLNMFAHVAMHVYNG